MDAEQPVFIDLGSGWYIMNETARRIAYTAAKYFAGKYERDAAQEMLDNPTEPKAPAPPDEPAQPPAPADDIPAGMVRLASVLNSRRRPGRCRSTRRPVGTLPGATHDPDHPASD